MCMCLLLCTAGKVLVSVYTMLMVKFTAYFYSIINDAVFAVMFTFNMSTRGIHAAS